MCIHPSLQHAFAAMHNLVDMSTRPLQNINKPIHIRIPTNNTHTHMRIFELTVTYTVGKKL